MLHKILLSIDQVHLAIKLRGEVLVFKLCIRYEHDLSVLNVTVRRKIVPFLLS